VEFIVNSISTALVAVTLFGCTNNIVDSKSSLEPPLRRIGFVAGAGSFEKMAITNRTFFDALGESGYVHGKTMEVVFRTAEGDMTKMPSLVDDVLRNNVEILVVSSSPGCAAAKAATTSTPVLCISVQDDPIKAGLTSTLVNPQSNVIGVYSFLPTGISQQLHWVNQFVPKLNTLGVLYNPENATHLRLLTEWSSVATEKGIRLVPMPVARAQDLDGAITHALEEKAQIGIGLLGPDTYAIRKEIAESAMSRRFPIVMDTPGGYTDMGGVATVGVNIVPYYRRGAVEQMIPMLHGKRPSELSWIGPKQVDVTTNDEAMRSFGLIVPTKSK
jgi:ABC-type uncharacterized transport system substrate-binding protein